ncbi:hypothetical protein Bca101_028644 [Brassica carinata]
MLPVNPPVPPVPPDPPPLLLVCAFLHHISSSFTIPHHRRDPKAPMPWFLCASTSFSLKLLCSYAVVITSTQPLGVQFFTAMCSSKSTPILHLKPCEDVTNPLSFWFKLHLPQYEDATLYITRLVYLAMVVHLITFNLLEEDGMPQEAPHSTLSSGPSSLQILSDFIVPFFALRTGLDLIEITCYFVRNLVPLVTPLSCSFNLCTIFVLVVVVYAMGAVPKLWCS